MSYLGKKMYLCKLLDRKGYVKECFGREGWEESTAEEMLKEVAFIREHQFPKGGWWLITDEDKDITVKGQIVKGEVQITGTYYCEADFHEDEARKKEYEKEYEMWHNEYIRYLKENKKNK